MTTDTDRATQLNSLLANLAAFLIEVPNPPAAVLATQPRLLLTVDEAAEQLSIGRTTAWALVRSGDLESVQVGKLDVEEHDLRAQPATLVQRGCAVHSLAHDLEALGLQHHPGAGPE